jgi:hypothetical protein
MLTEGELNQAQQRAEALDAAALTLSRTGGSTKELLDRAQACFDWLSGRKPGEVVRLTPPLKTASPPQVPSG